MEIFPLVGKDLQVMAMANALLSLKDQSLNTLTVGELSKLGYLGYFLSKEECWLDTMECLIRGECVKKCSLKAKEAVGELKYPAWKDVEKELQMLARLLAVTYRKKKRRIDDSLKKVIGIESTPQELYVILAFTPSTTFFMEGGVLTFNETEGYVYVFGNELYTPQHILDVALHELLHIAWRISEVPLPDDVEENVIDALCPEGFLSQYLGLTYTPKKIKGRLENTISRFFDEKLWIQGKKLLEYLSDFSGKGTTSS